MIKNLMGLKKEREKFNFISDTARQRTMFRYLETTDQEKCCNISKSLSVLNCNFSKEQSTLPEDDRMIETCRSVLSVLM